MSKLSEDERRDMLCKELEEFEAGLEEDRTNDGSSPLWFDVDDDAVKRLQAYLEQYAERMGALDVPDPAHPRLAMVNTKAQIFEVNFLQEYFKCDLEIEIRIYNHDFVSKLCQGLPLADLRGFIDDKKKLNEMDEDEYDQHVLDGDYRFYQVSPGDLSDANADEYLPQISIRNFEQSKLTFDSVSIHASGMVSIRKNFLVEYRELMELENFPFDRQLLRVEFHVSRCWPVDMPFWAYVGDKYYEVPFNIQRDNEIVKAMYYYGYTAAWERSSLQGFDSMCEVSIEMERRPAYYFYNFIGVYYWILALLAGAFLVGRDDAGSRMGYQMTIILAAVAFRITLVSQFPILPYLTYADKYQSVIIIYSVVWIVVSNLFTTNIGIQLVFPGETLSNDAVRDLDVQINLAFLGVFTLFHLLLILGWFTSVFKVSWKKVYDNNAATPAEFEPRKGTEVAPKELWGAQYRLPEGTYNPVGCVRCCSKLTGGGTPEEVHSPLLQLAKEKIPAEYQEWQAPTAMQTIGRNVVYDPKGFASLPETDVTLNVL